MSAPSNVDATWIDWTDGTRPTAPAASHSYTNKSSCTITHGDLDAQGPQHLERLRQGSRPEQRRRRNTPTGDGAATKFRAHQAGLPDRDDAAVHRLDGAATPRSTR